jgi:ribosome maturation factor RimP
VATKVEQLRVLLQPVVESMGFIFWGLEYLAQGKQNILRVYIDHEDGINVDQCARVSRQISAVMDVEDPIRSEYNLEVSSPGMDRLLFTLQQYLDYTGALVQLRLRVPYEGRRKFQGVLKGVEGEDIVLHVEDHEYLLPIDSIEKAQVIPQFKENKG